MTVLQVNGLQIKRGERQIIDNLSFQIEAGQRFFVQGEIGTGKTTLLLALLGFVPITRGDIRLFGQLCREEKDFAPFRGPVGLCFQHADDQLFGPTVLYAVALQQLERLGIAHLQDRTVHTLSGGEKNFTALAGVLAMQPKMLLLDEPTNGLDRKNTEKLTALLRELSLPMLVASHHQGFTAELADDVLTL